METKHTELPFYAHQRKNYIAITTKEAPGNPKWDIARVYDMPNAEFIVRACNAHYNLLEASMQAFAVFSKDKRFLYITDKLKQAIAKATK